MRLSVSIDIPGSSESLSTGDAKKLIATMLTCDIKRHFPDARLVVGIFEDPEKLTPTEFIRWFAMRLGDTPESRKLVEIAKRVESLLDEITRMRKILETIS
jgi:hypothetical protein